MKKKMMVKYNGGVDSFLGCSDPSVLTEGMIYEVIDEEIESCQTTYTLKGVEGEFNSVWFDEVEGNYFLPSYLATSNLIPIVGVSYKCERLIKGEKGWKFQSVVTSIVESVNQLGRNIYQLKTQNSEYIVQIN